MKQNIEQKHCARNEKIARLVLAGHGTTWLELGSIVIDGKKRRMIYGYNYVYKVVTYTIIAKNGSTNFDTIKVFVGRIPNR